jgi:putative FmdB family regulatory protein
MPLYDYSCSKCEHKFDKFLSISNRDTPLTEPCPACNELSVVRDVNGVGLVQWETNVKPDNTFTDILKQVRKNNVGSTMDEKFYK